MKHSTNHFITHSTRLFQEKAADFGTSTSDFSGTSYVDKSYKLVGVGDRKFVNTCKCRCFATNTGRYWGGTINEIYLQTIAQEVYELDEGQRSLLDGIIYQCPKAGGTSVYGARALYATVNDKVLYDDVTTCINQGITWRISNQPSLSNDLRLYPNPTQDLVHIQFTDAYLGQSLLFYNSIGQKVKTVTLPLSVIPDFEVNVKDLPQGIYYLLVLGKMPQVLKLVIE